MKKIAVLVIALVLALLTANTALAKFVDASDNSVTSGTSLVDVKIVERTKGSDENEVLDGVSQVDETLKNLAPGDTIVLSYKIINDGTSDVLLDGINITTDNQDFMKQLSLKWTLTKYEGSQAVSSVSNSINGVSLLQANGLTNVSYADIVLNNNSKDNYCLLELKITFDDEASLSKEVQETVFTVTPSFRQN